MPKRNAPLLTCAAADVDLLESRLEDACLGVVEDTDATEAIQDALRERLRAFRASVMDYVRGAVDASEDAEPDPVSHATMESQNAALVDRVAALERQVDAAAARLLDERSRLPAAIQDAIERGTAASLKRVREDVEDADDDEDAADEAARRALPGQMAEHWAVDPRARVLAKAPAAAASAARALDAASSAVDERAVAAQATLKAKQELEGTAQSEVDKVMRGKRGPTARTPRRR